MAEVTLTVSIFPTKLDVGGGVVGGGSRFQELLLAPLFSGFAHRYVKSGFDTLTGSGLNRTVNVGVAVVDGYIVSGTGQSPTLAFSPSTTNVLWLQLVKAPSGPDIGRVTGAKLVTTNTSTILADAVRLRHAVTSGSDITSQVDVRPEGRMSYGRLNFTTAWNVTDFGSGDWTLSGSSVVTFGAAFRRIPMILVTPDVSKTAFAQSPSTSAFTVGLSAASGDQVSFTAWL